MRAIVAGAVRRRVTVVMAVLAVVAFGFVGYSRLSVELFPDISYPSITVQTDFPDTAPQEVENLISRRIEEAVGVLSGLQSVHSVSRSGSSEVLLEFEWGSNMDDMSMEVREKIQRLHLPREAETPIVLRFDPSLDPILRLALSGPGDLGSLRYLAERRIKQALETRPGVAAAQVAGGLEEEIQIEVDQEGLAARGITLETVQAIVGVSNLNLPGGSLRSNERHYLVRTINEFENLDEIRNLVVAQRGGAAIRLSDVAKVTRGAKEREIITRIDGRESIEISIYKEGDANIVATANDVKNVIAQWQEKLKAENNTLTILFDQSIFISQAVGEVRKAALIGGALAIIILFFFLRDIRSTLIVATSIPISVIATFMFMYKMDVSLNLMSLGGLTLGLGMLLDSSIVVLESIFRKRQQGAPLREASIEGTTEIGPAVEGIDVEDLIVEEDMVVTVSHAGYIKRNPLTQYRAQRRGGKGVKGMAARDEDFVEQLFVASTHAYLLFFTTLGRVHWLKVHELPQLGRAAKGRALSNVLQLQEGERVQALLRKENLKLDPDVQLLEDIICLVFLESYFADFSEQHDEKKLINIIRRTWKKMSPQGHQAALELELPSELASIIEKALTD